MKKRMVFTSLLLVALITGCSSAPEYKVKVTKDLYYQKDTAIPLAIKLTENKKAALGLNVSAQLSMTNMDHGTYDVALAEGKDGIYSGKVQLPMAGKYEAVLTFEKAGKKSEKVINL